ncbi:MAG: hypothetical protein GXX96_27400 [Planctomycetaceae bacterium]|nr:hypothetical protein [Planctomycetaceae bacterium]
MSIWNKILLVCIFLTAIVLFVLSTRALQAHRVWQQSYEQHKQAIADAEKKVKDLVNGTESEPGLRQVKLELFELLSGRGRVWNNCRPVSVVKEEDPATKQERIRITVQTPNPVEAKTVLYAFEAKPAGEPAVYLGQFTAAEVDAAGPQVILEPSVRLSDEELARVQASQQAQTPWRLYELMPADNREILSELTEEQKRALFPNEQTFGDPKYSTINDYLYDGQIIMKDEAEKLGLHGTVVMVNEAGEPIREEAGERKGLYKEVESGKGMFIRTLYDYEVLFDEGHRMRSMAEDRIRIARRDLQFLQAVLDDSRKQKQARQKEIQDLQQELLKASHERDAVREQESKLDAAIASMKRAIDGLIAYNEATMAEVGRIQAEAAEVINARTASVVQASARQPTGP